MFGPPPPPQVFEQAVQVEPSQVGSQVPVEPQVQVGPQAQVEPPPQVEEN